ncbi:MULTISPECIES: type II toxin-antitoxin system RelE/ParE family toxin [Carnobacterium]
MLLKVKFSSNIFRCLYFHKSNSKYTITHGFTKKLLQEKLLNQKSIVKTT